MYRFLFSSTALFFALLFICGCGSQQPEQPTKDASTTSQPENVTSSPEPRAQPQFRYLDRCDKLLSSLEAAIERADWSQAVDDVEEVRLILKTYKIMAQRKTPVASRHGACQANVGTASQRLREALTARQDEVLKLVRTGEISYLYLSILFGDGASDSSLMRAAKAELSGIARRERGSSICVYIELRDEPLLTFYLRKAVRELGVTQNRRVFVWSLGGMDGVSSEPWLRVELRTELKKEPLTYSYKDTRMHAGARSSGVVVSPVLRSHAGVITSWHDTPRVRWKLPVDYVLKSGGDQDWLAEYARAYAAETTARMAMEALREQLGPIRIHPEAHDEMTRLDAPLTAPLLRARYAHHTDKFSESVMKALSSKPTVETLRDIATVLADQQDSKFDLSPLLAALKTVPENDRHSFVIYLFQNHPRVHRDVSIAIAAQCGEPDRILSFLDVRTPEFETAALPYVNGDIPCVSKTRKMLVSQVLRQTGAAAAAQRELAARWLADEDFDFAIYVAGLMLSRNVDGTLELLREQIKLDEKSGKFLAAIAYKSALFEDPQITLKAFELMHVVKAKDVQRRLMSIVRRNCGRSPELWKAGYKVYQNETLNRPDRMKVLKALKEHASIVDAETLKSMPL